MARGVKVNGELVRKLRDARGLSQDKLAEITGTSRPTANRLENGHPVTLATIEKYADALGVSPDWLLEKTFADVILEESVRDREPMVVGAGGAPIDFSDSAGTAFMDRVEAGDGVEELHDDVEQYFDYLPKYMVEPDHVDREWTIEGFERNLGWGLAALARQDREQGAEAITQVIRRVREMLESKE